MRQNKTQTLLDSLTGEDAIRVIRNLCASDAATRERVLADVHEVLATADPEEIADDVLWDLESLDVEDVYAHSGPCRDGYSTPDEAAAQIIEQTLGPYCEKMDRYWDLGMVSQMNACLMGILKGVYMFDHEAESEFKDAAPDSLGESVGPVFGQWWKRAGKRHRQQMKAFVSAQCPEWAGRLTRD